MDVYAAARKLDAARGAAFTLFNAVYGLLVPAPDFELAADTSSWIVYEFIDPAVRLSVFPYEGDDLVYAFDGDAREIRSNPYAPLSKANAALNEAGAA